MSYISRIKGKIEISVESTILLEIYCCGEESYVVLDWLHRHTYVRVQIWARLSYYNEKSYLRINGKNEISVKSSILLEIYCCGEESYVVQD